MKNQDHCKKEKEVAYDEELRDILIAVSVMAKRMAAKLESQRVAEKVKEVY